MMLCFPLVSSADPKRGVNDDVFLLLICFFRGDEKECSKARSNFCPHRVAGLSRVLVPHHIVR